MKEEFTIDNLPPMFNQEVYAQAMGISLAKAERDRCLGKGPAYVKLGGAVRYKREVVLEYVDRCTVSGEGIA